MAAGGGNVGVGRRPGVDAGAGGDGQVGLQEDLARNGWWDCWYESRSEGWLERLVGIARQVSKPGQPCLAATEYKAGRDRTSLAQTP